MQLPAPPPLTTCLGPMQYRWSAGTPSCSRRTTEMIFCEALSLTPELSSACHQGVAGAHTGSRLTGPNSAANLPCPSSPAHRLGSFVAGVRLVGGAWGPEGAAALRSLRAQEVIPILVPQRERWPIKHQQLHQPVLPVFWSVGLPVQADVWGGGVRAEEGADESSLDPLPATPTAAYSPILRAGGKWGTSPSP